MYFCCPIHDKFSTFYIFWSDDYCHVHVSCNSFCTVSQSIQISEFQQTLTLVRPHVAVTLFLKGEEAQRSYSTCCHQAPLSPLVDIYLSFRPPLLIPFPDHDNSFYLPFHFFLHYIRTADRLRLAMLTCFCVHFSVRCSDSSYLHANVKPSHILVFHVLPDMRDADSCHTFAQSHAGIS